MEIIKLNITLNGTDENWMAKHWGLKYNPFPQIAKAEYAAHDRAINSLSGDPIPDAEHIRNTLKGLFSDDFINLVCSKFEKGKKITFSVVLHVE